MEIQLDLGSPDTPLHVVAAGRLDVRNAAAFQQLMSALQQAAGTGFTCDLSGAQVTDAAGRSAVESVRKRTEEFGGEIVVGRPVVGRPAPAGTLGHQRPGEPPQGQQRPDDDLPGPGA